MENTQAQMEAEVMEMKSRLGKKIKGSEEINSEKILNKFGDAVLMSDLVKEWGKDEVTLFLNRSKEWVHKKVKVDGTRVMRWIYIGVPAPVESKTRKLTMSTDELLLEAVLRGADPEYAEKLRKEWAAEELFEAKWRDLYSYFLNTINHYTFGLQGFELEQLKGMTCIAYIDYLSPDKKETDPHYKDFKDWFGQCEKVKVETGVDLLEWRNIVRGLKIVEKVGGKRGALATLILNDWFEFYEKDNQYLFAPRDPQVTETMDEAVQRHLRVV